MKEPYIITLSDIIGQKNFDYPTLCREIDGIYHSILNEPIIKLFEYMIDPFAYDNNDIYLQYHNEYQTVASKLKEQYLLLNNHLEKGRISGSLDTFIPEGRMDLYGKDEAKFIHINDPKKEKLADYPAIINECHNEDLDKYYLTEFYVVFDTSSLQ